MTSIKEFRRANCKVIWCKAGGWIEVEDKTMPTILQRIAITHAEMLLIYMALGDALKGKV